jgi:hypothetical protein
MPEPRGIILSLVERGWQAARECSLQVPGDRALVIHLVKGRLSRAVRGMIEPHEHIRLWSVPRRLFWPCAWILWMALRWRGRLAATLVDNDRSLGRVRAWRRGATGGVFLVKPSARGYELRDDPQGRPLSPSWLSRVVLA